MVELLITVCLLSEPAQCKSVSLVFADISPMQCLMGAQPEMAKWVSTHPEHSIKSWKCQTVFANRDA